MKLEKNYSKRFLKGMAMLMLIVFTFSSCKKDHDSPPAAVVSIEGTYAGKYGFGNDIPDADQKYSIKAGGIFQEIGVNSGAVVGQGTWQLNGNTLTATYSMVFSPFSKYSVSGTFDPSTKKLTGTWGFDESFSDGGKIDMAKQ